MEVWLELRDYEREAILVEPTGSEGLEAGDDIKGKPGCQ